MAFQSGLFIYCIVGVLLQNVSGRGQFQVRLIQIQNIDGVKSDGSCCDGTRSMIHGLNRCQPDNCDTFFRICLQHYQEKVQENGGCTLGNATTPILGRDTFFIADTSNATSPSFQNPVSMHFEFLWLIKFNLIVEAWDKDNETRPVKQELIERDKLQGSLNPGVKWQKRTHNGQSATIQYEYRVICDHNYYGQKCNTRCTARNDRFGHYTCDSSGMRVCMPGWTGAECTKAICKTGCDENNGKCSEPGECVCHAGWKGPLCDQCIPDLKCVHGTCYKPWECQCLDSWGGTYCDKDLNMCARQVWCQNQGTCINSRPGEYTCICPVGYTGKNCEQNINECMSNPCKNNGNCSDGTNNYTCQCTQGWEGRDCELSVDDCKNNENCLNGATCVDDVNDYKCDCAPGWQGRHCETNIDECASKPCVHYTNCTDLQQDFSCVCKPGWKGKTCNDSVSDCLGQCLRGRCVDLVNDYQCVCPQGYTGKDCEQNIDDCLSSPCFNNAICVDGTHGYHCVCPTGFKGPRCGNTTDECAASPCLHGKCIDLPSDYRCECNMTYYGTNCSRKMGPSPDGCYKNNRCKHGSKCISEGNATKCVCLPGYTGDLCQVDINDCGSNPCLNSGKCMDRVNSFQCICPHGYGGSRCEIDVDECDPSPCNSNATCENLPGNYRCHCQTGFTGLHCNHNIDYCATGNPCKNGGCCLDGLTNYSCQCSQDFTGAHCEIAVQRCSSNPCQNSGKCIDVTNGYTCNCPALFTGSHCELKIDPCRSRPCSNGGFCNQTDNGFQCSCVAGFTGILCKTRIQYCNPSPCLHGTCIGNLSAICLCHPGYEGDRCETNIDECQSNPCKNNATCVDGVNSFHCRCVLGTKGKYCEELLNVCWLPLSSGGDNQTRVSSNICGDHGDCHSLSGGNFICSCHAGYTGAQCRDEINECSSNRCQNGATCLDKLLSYECQCKPGWKGKFCEKKIDFCASSPCLHQGNCTSITETFVCQCRDGWKGQTCNSETSHCDKVNPCKNSGTCRDIGTRFSCKCSDGWQGRTCELPIRPCDSNPCASGATCMNTLSNFSCLCPPNKRGDLCDEEVKLCDTATCYNGGRCLDIPGSFSCDCAAGFTGANCRVNIDECEPSPCFGGGICKDGVNSFTCLCTKDHYGMLCEKKRPDNCQRNHIERDHGSSWRENCNTCTCNDGAVKCTRVLCPPQNCIPHDTNHFPTCEEHGSRCIEMKNVSCLREPCPRFGECVGKDGEQEKEGDIEAMIKLECDPRSNEVSDDCAKVHIVFSKDKLPIGILLPDLCRYLSSLDLFHRYAKDKYIKVRCDVTPVNAPSTSKARRSAEVTVAVASDEGTGDAVKAATDLAKYVKLQSEQYEKSNVTIIQIIFAITKVTIERPVVIIYRRGKETPVYLIPVIAGLVVIAAFVLLLVIICERRRRRKRKQHRRQTYEETTKLKRRDSEDADAVETASEASRGLRKEGSFTELRDIEPEEIDVSVTGPTERAVSRSSIEVLSPARTPREHGARDEWRRKEILNLQQKSSEEIIV